ncbi:MAG: ATP-binding cassette domain-containing protein [Gemmatimonadales bacterium]
MLSASRLTKAYDEVVALDNLDLTVPAGEVFCLLGANGAGKTTTINLFLNFIQPTSGTVTVGERRRGSPPPRRPCGRWPTSRSR